MADKGNSSQLKRWLAVVSAALCLSAIITPVDAQQRDKTRRSEQTGASTKSATTTTAPVTATDRTGDTGTAPEATAPQGTTEVTAETTSATTAETPEGDTLRPRRIKPERPFYFTAQYVQRFDDNVLLSSENAKSDLVSVPTVGFGVERVRPRSLVRIDYQGGAEIYRRFSKLNGALHSLDFISEYDLSKRTLVFITDRFLRRPLTTGFGLFGPAGTDAAALNVFTPTRSTINDLSVGLTHQLTRFSTVRANYTYSLSRFNDSRLIDFDENAIELGYSRQANRSRDYDIAYRMSRFTGVGAITTHTLLPTIRYRYKRGLTLRAGAGPQLAVTLSGTQIFPAGLLELTYATRETVYGIAYSTGVGASGGLAVATRNHTLFGTFDHTFNRKLQWELRAGYSRSSASVGSVVSPLAALGFTNTGLIFENRVAYPLGHKMALFFDYSYNRQTGSGTTANRLNRNLFSLGINFDTRRSERSTMLRTGRF
jgi:hypothetical protein